MENDNMIENVEGLPQLTLQTKVLSIGDPEETESIKRKPSHDPSTFESDFRQHLGSLLLNSHGPMEPVEGWNHGERFLVIGKNRTNEPRRFYFFCSKHYICPAGSVFGGPAYCSRYVLDEVHKQLNDENWINNLELETPLRTRPPKVYESCDEYLQDIASKAVDKEEHRLISYIIASHRDYVRNKKP